MVRTRFAPSPTGFLHVGGLRTALYEYLIAKKNGGQFILRFEDTDQKRFVEGGMENILKSLYWAGIIPDEGMFLNEKGVVDQKGDKGPYIQSQKLEIYRKYADELVEKGHAYYCFCTPERLKELREHQQKNKLPTGYDGHCRMIDPTEAKQQIANGHKYVIRMKMPKEGVTTHNDLILGEISFKNELLDDQVIIKSDGFPTYHLAATVDDHVMGINPVIRGDEWLSSTPKHIQLYKYLGWEIPPIGHIPLLLNPDKSKLSKRQGDVAVEDYVKKGYLPEAMVNFVALMGWNPGDERELFTLDDLIKEFDISKINKSGAVFNLEKLDWFNQQYIRKLSDEELAERAMPWLKEADLDSMPKEFLAKAVSLEKERIVTLAELPEATKFIFHVPEYEGKMLIWKKSSVEEARKVLRELAEELDTKSVQAWNRVDLESDIKKWIGERGYQNGSVLWPLRVALSGQEKSPSPFEIAEVLGKEETSARLKSAISRMI
ncbi:glutamate--tRNA ligase [Patescibacteria group bacterium]|nr:glutamate--tRNA ligase [Patescibacteria group bacterium]MBU1613265.1 glutamate--tRNA ligase [Patescibacteria group bacterium]